jgi:molecular chaperone DnaJ
VRGRGVAQLRGDRRGDLLVLIDVRIPKKLDSHQQKLMNELGESLPDTFEDDEDKGIFDKFRSAFTN